jgi:hypothetical protein
MIRYDQAERVSRKFAAFRSLPDDPFPGILRFGKYYFATESPPGSSLQVSLKALREA